MGRTSNGMKTNLAANLLPPGAPGNSTPVDIRGIKPPVEIPNEWAWLWWTLAAIVVVMTALWLWQVLRKRLLGLPPVLLIPPHVRAKQRLEEALQFLSEPNRFCTRVADTIRVYLEERFFLRAPERTTEEFLLE